MPTRFRAYQPDQILLLPVKLKEWVPEGHLAHQVSDVVDDLDLRAFYAPYEGDGRRKSPYSPTMMVKVLLYGYATGVFSSRGIARKLEEDVAFRMLAAGDAPKHRTICEFRRRHLKDFRKLFLEVVQVSRAMGLVRLGTLSLDGTKVRANASKRKAMSYDRMVIEESRLSEEIEELTATAERVDEEEDRRFGKEFGGTSCRRSCGVGRIGWRRSRPRRSGWRRRSGTRMTSGADSRVKSVRRRMGTATSGGMASRTRRRRATSRTRRAGS